MVIIVTDFQPPFSTIHCIFITLFLDLQQPIKPMKASTLVNIKFGLIDLSYFEMKAPFNLSITMCYT